MKHLATIDRLARAVCECGYTGPWRELDTDDIDAEEDVDRHMIESFADEASADADYMVDQQKEGE